MRHSSLTHQRTAHQNETFVNKPIDKRRVFIPKRLLSRALRRITIQAGGRNCDKRTFHPRIQPDLLSTHYRRFAQIF